MSEVKEWKEITVEGQVYRMGVQDYGIGWYEPSADYFGNPTWGIVEFISKQDYPMVYEILREVYKNLPEVSK